ncbi:hypothetical protein, conserved [Babesia ovata]|uniref:Uncharacterized protein n=1 Tax=Babesia ovata TaxID=189622 RepID=A0A2H6KDL1_9APIC|nr:uncharacterized protein BOVATA_025760 [Babesia ovata]GBE61083.1 hypothetical protein, conserved [Babesia ovata]
MPPSLRGSQLSGNSYTLESEFDESAINTSGSFSRHSYESKPSRGSSRRTNVASREFDHAEDEAMSERQESSRSSSGSLKNKQMENETKMSMAAQSDKSSMHLASFFTKQTSRSSGGGTGRSKRSDSSQRSSARSSGDGEIDHGSQSRNSVSSKAKERSSSRSSHSSEGVEIGPYSNTQVNSPVADDRIRQACSKYGLDSDSLQEILEGRHRSQKSDVSLSKHDQRSENGDTSPDSFRDEMLVYLLQQQLKLKAELKAQKSRGQGSHASDETPVRSSRSYQSEGSARSNKSYKALEEVTPNELRQIQERWSGDNVRDQEESYATGTPTKQRTRSHAPATRNGDDFTPEDTYSSRGSQKSRRQQEASHAGNIEIVADEDPVYERNSRRMNTDELVIQNEASSLHNEIEQIIDSLESSTMDQMSDGTVPVNLNEGMREPPFVPQYSEQFVGPNSGNFNLYNGNQPYMNNGSNSYKNNGSDRYMNNGDHPYMSNGHNSYMNNGNNSYMHNRDDPYVYSDDEYYGEELALPIKVPTKPPKPDVMDAMVMTDQTARENELNAYERVSRELDQEAFDNQGAYQTDNTRITKDGISWEITESYLKEEERRMLLEQKRAQLLQQLKEVPYAKTQTLQDHYAKWVAKKASMSKPGENRPEEQVGGDKSSDRNGESCHMPCNVFEPAVATCGANIFRRTRGNSRQRQASNHSTDSKSTPPPRRADQQTPKETHRVPMQPPMNEPPYNGDAMPNRKDIYIKGSWDPHTGALRISNDLDSSQNTDKTRILDDYVDFLKQNPGNWSRDHSLDETPVPAPMALARVEEQPIRKTDIAKEIRDKREEDPTPYVPRNVSVTESVKSEKSLTLTSSSSSAGSQGDLYENDEFYPPSGPLPGDSSGVEFTPPAQQQKYAMGFSDPYMPPVRSASDLFMPPVRSASDLYSSSVAHMAMLNGARAPANKPEEQSHHHHYHYHCSERHHRACSHRKRHSCRHKHRSTCSHRKHSHVHSGAPDDFEHSKEHRRSVSRGRSMATMTSRDFEPAEKPMPMVERQEMKMAQMSPKIESGKQSPSIASRSPSPRSQSSPVQRKVSNIPIAAPFGPSFGMCDDGRYSSGGTDESDEAPLSFRDIITNSGSLKSTDFVKVTTYHSPEDENDVAEQQPAEPQVESEPDVHIKPSAWCCAATTKSEDAAAEQPKADANGPPDDTTHRADSMCRTPSPSYTPPWSTSPLRHPHVFSRRVHTRANSPKVCVSPLAKLENGECPTLCRRHETYSCKVCYDSEAESSEQFTFRDNRSEDPKPANAPPIIKTRVLVQPHAAGSDVVLQAVPVKLGLRAQQTHARYVCHVHHEASPSNAMVQSDVDDVHHVVVGAEKVVLTLRSDQREEVPREDLVRLDEVVVKDVRR